MKCTYCGADIPEEQLVCPRCGREVQIVPDYNPLDEVLTAHVKGALDKTMSLEENRKNGSADSNRRRDYTGRQNYTGRQDRGMTGRSRSATGRTQGRTTGHTRTSRMDDRTRSLSSTRSLSREEQAARKRKAEKKRERAKKKRLRLLLILGILLILTVAGGILIYQNSYSGQLRQGYQALEAGNYDDALARFQRAVSRDEERPEAYTGMSQVYIEQDNLDQAEQVFLDALEGQDSNTELYRAAITFYLDTSQEQKVSELLENCSSDRVLRELAQYVSEPPEFSLDEDEVYEDVQALELTGSGTAIYYTTDGSEPDTSSTKYTEPITLNEETTVVKAISVNEEGIPSVTVEKTFQIEFPAIAAPNVTPSTGQYSTSQTIEVEQLEDYEIRYTTDGTMPDSGSELYTGPIDMPEGSTVFTFVYIDKSGRVSQSTTRSYELVY
ncbi:MAG TPA: chitobiase/beta-hexosaminidase C-terminal domain-containing protein [Candidatus Bariatricus faecipullorum]|nr:chitobiase/beta-hexosaminidase C-terminal domain-containing protein [Candidatus Bariatricus faecipullorum]